MSKIAARLRAKPSLQNRCGVIVPSGIGTPATYRCWHPLPCPHHGGHEEIKVNVHNELSPHCRTCTCPGLRHHPRAGFGR